MMHMLLAFLDGPDQEDFIAMLCFSTIALQFVSGYSTQ